MKFLIKFQCKKEFKVLDYSSPKANYVPCPPVPLRGKGEEASQRRKRGEEAKGSMGTTPFRATNPMFNFSNQVTAPNNLNNYSGQ